MFRPSLKSNWSLLGLAILSVALFIVSQNSYRTVKMKWFDQKLEASQKMDKFMKVLKKEVELRGYEIDQTNDPNLTGLIGPKVTTITTSRGILSDKIASLNPDFAAVFVDYFKKQKLKKGDHIAVGLTGANPGINLALYAAIQALELKPLIITSVGSASFGANREDFTWLDMESFLYDKKLISFKSQFASLGGGNDTGRGLSKVGRDTLRSTIIKRGCELIYEGDLTSNIDKRMNAYNNAFNGEINYKMFINIGGSLANVGDFINTKLIKTGLHRNLANFNFERKGCIAYFAKKNTPILHIFDISLLAKRYGLPLEPPADLSPGNSEVFIKQVNNVFVASISLVVVLIAVFLVVVFDRKDRHFTRNIVDTDSHL